MKETTVVNDARAKLSNGNVRLFRNNVGVLVDRTGKHVRYGLCVGSSDLIGFKSVRITKDMVGQRIAQFVALEGKGTKGVVTACQQAFLDLVVDMGGIAGVFTSVDHARMLLDNEV